jgi:hypothetical protein
MSVNKIIPVAGDSTVVIYFSRFAEVEVLLIKPKEGTDNGYLVGGEKLFSPSGHAG